MALDLGWKGQNVVHRSQMQQIQMQKRLLEADPTVIIVEKELKVHASDWKW